jgi:kynurenine formamidase
MRILYLCLILVVTTIFLCRSNVAWAGETPIGPKWWPSPYGEKDEAGATNLITPDRVLAATKIIKKGKVIRIGRDYERGMPLFGNRDFALRIPGGPTGGPFGKNKIIWNDEFLATEIGQVGTQLDGLGHIGVHVSGQDEGETRYYNGVTGAELISPYGLKKLGVEKLKPLFTPGHLVDMVALKGGMMDAGQEITVADIEAALAKQGKSHNDIRPGDVVLFYTGWGSLWMKDNKRFNAGQPGIGVEAAKWLAKKQVALVGSDVWGIEVVPNPDPDLAFPAHQILITKNGILLHENLATERLASAGIYTFAYIYTPVPIKGATGSPGSPIAVY